MNVLPFIFMEQRVLATLYLCTTRHGGTHTQLISNNHEHSGIAHSGRPCAMCVKRVTGTTSLLVYAAVWALVIA